MDSSGSTAIEAGLTFLRLTSHTKPGPNMAFAVAMKVARKDSGEEKELEIVRFRESDMGLGSGERPAKKLWLL